MTTSHSIPGTHARPAASFGAAIRRLRAACRSHRRAAATRRALRALTPEQLRDVGLDDAVDPAPRLEVRAGLLTSLMALR